uniref:Putative ovule protein n=1 Tax=Solanum chacoense TaxID=4108 RepID=A0A0V0GXS3_SOLCH
MIGLCRAITKQSKKSKEYNIQYVDIKINGRPTRAMVDTGAEANVMTKTATTKLGLSYSPSNTHLKTVNTQHTSNSRVRSRSWSKHYVRQVAR